MNNYYIDSVNGDDANPGTSEALAFKTLQKYMDLGLAGDLSAHSLNLAKGSHWREFLSFTNASGTAASKFKISTYGTGDKPIINGADLCDGFTQHSGSIYKKTSVTTEQDIFYQDMRVPKVSSLGSVVENTAYYDSTGDILYVWLSDGNNPNSIADISERDNCVRVKTADGWVNIDGVNAIHGRVIGIAFSTPNVTDTPTGCRITNNLVQRCGIDAVIGTGSDGILCYGGAAASRLTNYVIASNIIEDCFNNAVEIAFADSCQIKFNASYRCGGNLVELWEGCSNNVIERNYCEDAVAFGLPTSFHKAFAWVTTNGTSTGNIFKSNICIGASKGIHVQQGANTIVNNVLIDITNRVLDITTTSTAIVKNNICGLDHSVGASSTTKYLYVDTALASNDIDNNIYYYSKIGSGEIGQWQALTNGINTGVFATWQAGGEDANSFNADPLLDSDYKPQSGSDALLGGILVAGVDLDYDGTAWAETPDIGALQTFKTPITSSARA